MDNIDINLYSALKEYYNHLFNTGYSSKKESDNLLVYTFIEELVKNFPSSSISEKDYSAINGALSCLYNSTCAIQHPQIKCSNYFLSEALVPLSSVVE